MIKLLVTILALVSCQKQKPKEAIQKSSEVSAKAELYKSLHRGWAHSKCDSLGFSALCRVASGCSEADIMQAEGEPGRWYRSPEHDCYDLGQSASDISKDMIIMLLPYLWRMKDKQNIQEIYDYAHRNNNLLGRGPISRTLMTPGLAIMLQEAAFRLKSIESETFEFNFEKHLDVIAIMTKAMMRGMISPLDLEILRRYKKEAPRNALVQAMFHKYTDGDQTEVIAILQDESLFPSDRLPTSSDRCEEYLWQRDDGADWKPCDQGKTHDGVDLLIAAWVAGQI